MTTLLYSGNLGIGQDLGTVLRAVASLTGESSLHILIVGNGKGLAHIRRLVAELKLAHTEFRAPVSLYELPDLLAAYGLTYHALAARLGTPTSAASIAPEALVRFPLQMGEWTGEDLPMDEALVRATGTDAHIHRRYARRDGLESVSVFIGCGVGAHERVLHRPEVCFARAGWTPLGQTTRELPLSDGTRLPCSIFQFQRGELRPEKATVLHYYVVDGQRCDNLTPLQSKLGRLGAGANYIARVLITAPGNLSTDGATKTVSSFAVDSALPLARLFDDLQSSGAAKKNPDPCPGP